jgi:hypothetical protein
MKMILDCHLRSRRMILSGYPISTVEVLLVSRVDDLQQNCTHSSLGHQMCEGVSHWF